MNYKDDTSVLSLLSGCPCLSNSFGQTVSFGGDRNIFTIAVHLCRVLSIYDENSGEEHQGYAINAPYEILAT